MKLQHNKRSDRDLGMVPGARSAKNCMSSRALDVAAGLDLEVGRHRFDTRFWRDGHQTESDVLMGDPNAGAKGNFDVQFV
jgi:hypothetical protein